jgi:hypothetical protein
LNLADLTQKLQFPYIAVTELFLTTKREAKAKKNSCGKKTEI